MQERDRKKRAQCAAQDPGRELGWHAAPLPLSPSHTTHSDTGYTKISGLTAKIFHCSQTQPHSATESCVGSHIRVRKYRLSYRIYSTAVSPYRCITHIASHMADHTCTIHMAHRAYQGLLKWIERGQGLFFYCEPWSRVNMKFSLYYIL